MIDADEFITPGVSSGTIQREMCGSHRGQSRDLCRQLFDSAHTSVDQYIKADLLRMSHSLLTLLISSLPECF